MRCQFCSLIFVTVAVFSLATSSCNKDVFVENDDLPQHTEVTLEGDGGQWSVPFSRNGLTHIYIIDCPENEKQYLTYLNLKGDLTGSYCDASDLKSINFENPARWYSFGFAGDMLYFSSNYNASTPYTVNLILEYNFGVDKLISINLTEGKPLRLDFYSPFGRIEIEEDIDQITRTTGLVNNSQLTQKLEIMPFSEAFCMDEITAEEAWADGLVSRMPMLIYDGHQWTWEEYDDIRIGEVRQFIPEEFSDKKITVNVPPNKTARVTYTLHYTRNRTEGEVGFYNPVADYLFHTNVTWTAVYATSFDYKVDYE